MNDPYETQVGGSHYKDMKIQPSEFINKNKLQFAEGNAIKYICRHGSKGQKQDLEKAKHYIDMIIDRDYGDDAEKSKVFLSGLPESDKDSMDDLSEGFKVTYGDVSISDEYIKSIPKDNLNDDVYYPSGVSVGQEGFDE
jgi:hypothetical protein